MFIICNFITTCSDYQLSLINNEKIVDLLVDVLKYHETILKLNNGIKITLLVIETFERLGDFNWDNWINRPEIFVNISLFLVNPCFNISLIGNKFLIVLFIELSIISNASLKLLCLSFGVKFFWSNIYGFLYISLAHSI